MRGKQLKLEDVDASLTLGEAPGVDTPTRNLGPEMYLYDLKTSLYYTVLVQQL